MSTGGAYVLSPLSAVTASRVAEAQVTELRELFACFDADRDGKLTTLELCSVIRALGHAPTSAELTALQMTVENVYGGLLNFDTYVRVLTTIVEPKMKTTTQVTSAFQDSLKCFEELCRGRSDGIITKAELRMLLTKYGDAIDDVSFDQLIRFLGLTDAKESTPIPYEHIVDVLAITAKAAKA